LASGSFISHEQAEQMKAMRQANAKLLRKLAGGGAYQKNKAANTN
jgi:hypothetical protein